MQCPSCQFENMPGSGRCARCGTSMVLATAAIDVHPPRAGRLWRLEHAFWRLWHRVSRVTAKTAPFLAAFSTGNDATNFDLGTFVRCVVPGWPQFRRGDRGRAGVFLFSYLILLLPGIVLAGSWFGSVLLGMAAAMHIASVCDAVVTSFATSSDRVAFTLVCGLMLNFLVYLPAAWLISRVATPISINVTMPPFQRGDVLWYSRVANPERGDLVVFTMTPLTAGNYVFQGDWIGRVIAMPGEKVSVQEERWLVDGVESQWQPAVHSSLTRGYSFTVPDGQLLVYPDGLVPAAAPLSAEQIQQLYSVPMARIAGRLYFRSLPLSQMSILN